MGTFLGNKCISRVLTKERIHNIPRESQLCHAQYPELCHHRHSACRLWDGHGAPWRAWRPASSGAGLWDGVSGKLALWGQAVGLFTPQGVGRHNLGIWRNMTSRWTWCLCHWRSVCHDLRPASIGRKVPKPQSSHWELLCIPCWGQKEVGAWVTLCQVLGTWDKHAPVRGLLGNRAEHSGRWGCFPGGTSGKESTCQCKRRGFSPWVRKIPWRRAWQPTPAFLPGESHGQKALAAYSLWGSKELDMT